MDLEGSGVISTVLEQGGTLGASNIGYAEGIGISVLNSELGGRGSIYVYQEVRVSSCVS